MANLLIVAHQPSENTKNLSAQIVAGAKHVANEEKLENAGTDNDTSDLSVRCLSPFDTTSDDVLACDAIILFTTENFGYMSGALKDFFDRTYYGVIDQKRGLPWGLIIRAGKDGTGTKRACKNIVKGLGWKTVLEPLILKGDFTESFLPQAREFGETFAAGLTCGIY